MKMTSLFCITTRVWWEKKSKIEAPKLTNVHQEKDVWYLEQKVNSYNH